MKLAIKPSTKRRHRQGFQDHRTLPPKRACSSTTIIRAPARPAASPAAADHQDVARA
jgi:hypothetical protein